MVMRRDSCSKCCGFESPHRILDAHFFTYICCKNCNVCLKRSKINEKEAGVGPFFLKKDVKILNILHRGWRKGNTETVGKYAQM